MKEKSLEQERVRSYVTLNRLLVLAFVLCLAWPFLVAALGACLKIDLFVCGSIRLFGRPCPMCGLTRGALAVVRGEFGQASAYNILTLPLSLLILVELLARGMIAAGTLRHDQLLRIIAVDRNVHTALFVLYLLYALVFVIRQW